MGMGTPTTLPKNPEATTKNPKFKYQTKIHKQLKKQKTITFPSQSLKGFPGFLF